MWGSAKAMDIGRRVNGAHAKAITLYGGALELGDLRLLEDGGERGDALDSDAVVPQTVSEEQSGDGERSGVSMGADTKANTIGCVAAHLSLEILVSLRTAASAEAPSAPMPLPSRLRSGDRMGDGERVGVSMGVDRKALYTGDGALEALEFCLR